MDILMVGAFGLRAKGSISARALPLAKALVRRGHQVRLVLPPWDSPADAGLRWVEGGVRIVCLPLAGVRDGRRSPLLALQVLLQTWVMDSDVLHAFKPIGYAGMAAQLGTYHLGRSAAIVVDMDDLEGREGWAVAASRSAGECWIRDWQECWALRGADALTVASEYLRQRALSAGRPAAQVQLLLNGCEPPAVLRPVPEPTEPFTILWPTRFAEVALPWTCVLWRRLLEALPQAHVCVAGRGLAGEEAAWDALWAAMPADLAGRLGRVGWLDGPAWERAARGAVLAVMPQDDTPINRARCPAKLPQLMAWGVPIVASAVGEAGTYIEEGHTGRLSPAGDADAFLAAVQEVWNAPDLRRRLGQAAAQRASVEWNWDRQAACAERAYREALGLDGNLFQRNRMTEVGREDAE